MIKFLKYLITTTSVGFLMLTTLNTATYAAVTNPYPKQLHDVLTKYNIDKANIKSQKTLETRITGRSDNRTQGYTTYIDFYDCKGYLAVYQHRFGRVENVYIKGDCQIPGIKNY